MLWIKAFHIIFMVAWFAGLFYLPRLFVYHAQVNDRADDQISNDRFKAMEQKLFFGIMTPGAILTIVFGLWLWLGYGFSGNWLNIKLLLVALVIAHHAWCYKTLVAFRNDANAHGPGFYRWMNELPVLLLAGIVILVVVKPF
ncbi:CopD family protein [Candidatus Spongiihabitans sp.]|uniref:CopD family protein n=1 Tax=Candidatus Spongiihabitans sp. TaxID=3101308 RepID=UPI003C7ABB00